MKQAPRGGAFKQGEVIMRGSIMVTAARFAAVLACLGTVAAAAWAFESQVDAAAAQNAAQEAAQSGAAENGAAESAAAAEIEDVCCGLNESTTVAACCRAQDAVAAGPSTAPRRVRATQTAEQAERRIREALAEPTTPDFVETPLQDVMQFFSREHHIPIWLDHRALDEFGVGTDTPITMNVAGLTFRSALELVLRDLDLTYITENEVLVITTPDEAAERLAVVVYPVADLLCPNDDGKVDYDSLIGVITGAVEPESWEDLGGTGSIAGIAGTLVVLQTDAVHELTASLLDTLREVGDPTLHAVTRPKTKTTSGGGGGGFGGGGGRSGADR